MIYKTLHITLKTEHTNPTNLISNVSMDTIRTDGTMVWNNTENEKVLFTF